MAAASACGQEDFQVSSMTTLCSVVLPEMYTEKGHGVLQSVRDRGREVAIETVVTVRAQRASVK